MSEREAEPSLTEEIAAVTHLHELARGGAPLPPIEADAIVRSLYATLHATSRPLLPLLRATEGDTRLVSRALNAAVLSMALAEELGLSPADVRAIGLAGLLHDIGMALVPEDVLEKTGALSDAEWHAVERHASEGARLLVGSGSSFELAAAVAYEHHLQPNAGGYPVLEYQRPSHFASRLVQVCDVFDALCAPRPDRRARSPQAALSHMLEQAGTQLEPEMVTTFAGMIRQAEADDRLRWLELG